MRVMSVRPGHANGSSCTRADDAHQRPLAALGCSTRRRESRSRRRALPGDEPPADVLDERLGGRIDCSRNRRLRNRAAQLAARRAPAGARPTRRRLARRPGHAALDPPTAAPRRELHGHASSTSFRSARIDRLGNAAISDAGPDAQEHRVPASRAALREVRTDFEYRVARRQRNRGPRAGRRSAASRPLPPRARRSAALRHGEMAPPASQAPSEHGVISGAVMKSRPVRVFCVPVA